MVPGNPKPDDLAKAIEQRLGEHVDRGQFEEGYYRRFIEASEQALNYSFSRGDYKDDSELFEEVAEQVFNFFGFEERIIYNPLRRSERSIFYKLEDLDLLTEEVEEVNLPVGGGKSWRVGWWKLKKDDILKAAEKYEEEEEVDFDASIYGSVEDDVWKDHLKHEEVKT